MKNDFRFYTIAFALMSVLSVSSLFASGMEAFAMEQRLNESTQEIARLQNEIAHTKFVLLETVEYANEITK